MADEKVYFENLNGLRFIAFFSVFIGHIFGFSRLKINSHVVNLVISHVFMHGDLGVNFFFVLSGFLITFLLLKEKSDKKSISLKKFYIRRILRIWPVYFLTICLGFFVIPFLFQNADSNLFPFGINIPLSKLPLYVSFTANFDLILHGVNFVVLAVLWSVSVEEQYYLVWPLINKIYSKHAFIIILGLLFLISYFYRWKFYDNKSFIKYSTFSVMNDLIVGSAIALASFKSFKFHLYFARMRKATLIFIYLLFFICLPLRGFIYYFSDTWDQILVSFEPFLFSLFFAFIILEQNYAQHSPFKISRIKLVNYLGTISYGLYCYHVIFIFITSYFLSLIFGRLIETNVLVFVFQTLISLVLTIFFSHLSYQYFERPFLRLKNKFTSHIVAEHLVGF